MIINVAALVERYCVSLQCGVGERADEEMRMRLQNTYPQKLEGGLRITICDVLCYALELVGVLALESSFDLNCCPPVRSVDMVH